MKTKPTRAVSEKVEWWIQEQWPTTLAWHDWMDAESPASAKSSMMRFQNALYPKLKFRIVKRIITESVIV